MVGLGSIAARVAVVLAGAQPAPAGAARPASCRVARGLSGEAGLGGQQRLEDPGHGFHLIDRDRFSGGMGHLD